GTCGKAKNLAIGFANLRAACVAGGWELGPGDGGAQWPPHGELTLFSRCSPTRAGRAISLEPSPARGGCSALAAGSRWRPIRGRLPEIAFVSSSWGAQLPAARLLSYELRWEQGACLHDQAHRCSGLRARYSRPPNMEARRAPASGAAHRARP